MDAGLERRRRGRARDRPTCSSEAQPGGRDLVHGRGRRRAALRRDRRDRRAVRRQRPRRMALSATVHYLPLDATGERVVAADFVSTTTVRASCTWRPRSARTTRSRARRGPAGPEPRRRRRQVRHDRAPPHRHVREGRRPRCSSTTSPRAASSCARCRTSTPTRTAGAAARPSSTGPRRRGSRARPSSVDELLRENERIGWHPEHIKHGRFGNWLENNVDWALSRDRYWGTPLPGLALRECGHDTCIGSVAELSRAGRPRPDRARPAPPVRRRRHLRVPGDGCAARPAGSRRCSTRGSTRARCRPRSTTTRSRAPSTFDEPFPADFICEAIDQTRGWFYSLLAVNTLVFDATPYRNVVCLGLIVDDDGQKMSKSRGNVIDPWTFRPSAPTRCAGTSSRPASPGRPAGSPTTASARPRARRCSRSGTSSRSSPTYADLDGWSRRRRAAAARADPRARPLGARRARRHRRRRHRRARQLRRARRGRTRSPRSSTTSRTGMCAAAGRGSGRHPTREPTPRSTVASSTTTQLLAPFCPFLADEIYTTLTGELSVHLPTGPTAAPRDPTLADRDASARAASSPSAAPRAPRPR